MSCSSLKWCIVTAPNGQMAAQPPQPAQAASTTVATSFFCQLMAPKGQIGTHWPHFLHSSGSM
jgi:hypothetical protein